MLDGTLNVTVASAGADAVLHAAEYAYIPTDTQHALSSDNGAGLLLFERHCIIPGRLFWLNEIVPGCLTTEGTARASKLQALKPAA